MKDLEDLKKQIIEIIDEKIDFHEYFREPKMVHYDRPNEAWCPNCGRFFDVNAEHYKFCPECGQKLKWEE